MKTKLSISSFSVGMGLPVSDIFSLYLETYIKLTKQTPNFRKVQGIFLQKNGYFNTQPSKHPILKIFQTPKKNQQPQTYPKTIRGFYNIRKFFSSNNENKNFFFEKHKKRTVFDDLSSTLLKVVLYLWYFLDENYSAVVCKNIKENCKNLPFWKRFFVARYIRKDMLSLLNEEMCGKKILKSSIWREFEKCMIKIRELIKFKKSRCFIGEEASEMDVMLYTFLSCIIYPPFKKNIFKTLFKDNRFVLRYLNGITKEIFPMYISQLNRLTFHNVKKFNIEMLKDLEKEEKKLLKETYITLGIGIGLFFTFYLLRKKLGMLPFDFIWNRFRKLESQTTVEKDEEKVVIDEEKDVIVVNEEDLEE